MDLGNRSITSCLTLSHDPYWELRKLATTSIPIRTFEVSQFGIRPALLRRSPTEVQGRQEETSISDPDTHVFHYILDPLMLNLPSDL